MHYLILVLVATAFAGKRAVDLDELFNEIFNSTQAPETSITTSQKPVFSEPNVPVTHRSPVSEPTTTVREIPRFSVPTAAVSRKPPVMEATINRPQEGSIADIISSVIRAVKETSSTLCFFCQQIVVQPEIKITITDQNSARPTNEDTNFGVESKDSTTAKDIVKLNPVEDTQTAVEGNYEHSIKNTSSARDANVKDTTDADRNGESCQCVPYYLCKTVAGGAEDGQGLIDISIGEKTNRQCEEYIEVCCTELLQPVIETTPAPEPAKPQTCGNRNPQGLVFAIGVDDFWKNDAKFGEFPWVVAILNSTTSLYQGVGALIHPQVVITGAHIAAKYRPGSMKIRAGEWDTQTVKEIYPYQERDVAEVIIHPAYQPRNLLINGVALLRLSKPLTNAPNINVLCLPEQDEKFDNHKNCIANGWGKNGFGKDSRYPVIMKKVVLDMVDHARCNMLLRRTRLEKFFTLHSSFVCAGGEEGKDTCQGDGGAPLACPVGKDQYKLVGMVAWSIGCGVQDVPAVYTNVAAFRTWTDEKMAEWGFQIQ